MTASEDRYPPRFLLASSSRYRAQLLRQLIDRFDCQAPEVDESRLPAESIPHCVIRLAELKARAVSHSHPNHWIIASDQIGWCNDLELTKPGTPECAIAQLTRCSGQEAVFYTSVCLLHPSGVMHLDQVPTRLRFRPLGRSEIECYVEEEPALDCAGGFKAEGKGIRLFSDISSSDPTALVGLPLIRLNDFLIKERLTRLSQ